jgi:hypothetical protein
MSRVGFSSALCSDLGELLVLRHRMQQGVEQTGDRMPRGGLSHNGRP